MSDLIHQHIVRKQNRKNILRRIEQRIVNAYDLMMNVMFFMRLGIRLRTAIYLARNIIRGQFFESREK